MKKILAAFAAVMSGLVPVVPVASSTVHATSVPSGASAYTAVAPHRLADTRAEEGSYGFTRLGATTIRVQVTGRFGIPQGSTAAVLNIAAVNPAGAGFVTAYPAGTPLPLASSLNVDQPGRTISNLATVQLSASGAVDLYTNVAMDLAVDVAGTYTPVNAAVQAGRLATIAGGAKRVLDTRDDGSRLGERGVHVVDLSAANVPKDATAVVVNLAAVDAAPGYWTAYPHGDTPPYASSLNIDQAGQTRNAQAIVAIHPGSGAFDVFSYGGGDLVVDVVGWYTGATSGLSTDGLFVPSAPQRKLDTRDSSSLAPWGGTTVEFDPGSVPGASVGAVAMNIAIADPWYVGFVTAYPAGQSRPLAANVNISAFNQIISNHAVVREGQRGIALFTQNGTHMIVDVTGWFLGTPDASTLPTPASPNPQASPAVSVAAASAGLDVAIGRGRDINTVINRGIAGIYAGTGYVGIPDHNVFFAHRTTHGGPFRYIDHMPLGSTFTLTGSDGTNYLYLVISIDVIVPTPAVLMDIVTHAAPITATVVACHPPGSVAYRLAITGRLIGLAPN